MVVQQPEASVSEGGQDDQILMTRDESIIELGVWLTTPPGQYLLAWEQERLDRAVADVFGFHALQLGLPEVDTLRANRMPHRWLASNGLAVPAAGTPELLPSSDESGPGQGARPRGTGGAVAPGQGERSQPVETTTQSRRVEEVVCELIAAEGVGAEQEGYYVVTNGLNQGERVITEGLQKVRPGMTVDAAEAPAAPAAG